MKNRVSLWMLLCGAVVGWLTGLSVSPVVGVVITTVIGILVGAAGTFAGISQEIGSENRKRLRYEDFAPIGLLLVGIAIGSVVGVSARTHSWLSPTIDEILNQWSAPNVELDRKEIAKRLFDERYPPPSAVAPEPEDKKASAGTTEAASPNSTGEAPASATASGPTNFSNITATALYATSLDECNEFRARDGEDLRARMRASVTSKKAREFAEKVQDPAALKAAVEVFLCPSH